MGFTPLKAPLPPARMRAPPPCRTACSHSHRPTVIALDIRERFPHCVHMATATNPQPSNPTIRDFAHRNQWSAAVIRLTVWAPSAGGPLVLDIEEVIPSLPTNAVGPWHPADIEAHFARTLAGWHRQGCTACTYTVEAIGQDWQAFEATAPALVGEA